eukprot:6400003-Prymnesium_polylepis.1
MRRVCSAAALATAKTGDRRSSSYPVQWRRPSDFTSAPLPRNVRVAPTLKIDNLTFVGFDYIDFMAYGLLLQHLPPGGVFFEAGATDGLYGSNTWFLGEPSAAILSPAALMYGVAYCFTNMWCCLLLDVYVWTAVCARRDGVAQRLSPPAR